MRCVLDVDDDAKLHLSFSDNAWKAAAAARPPSEYQATVIACVAG
jgi:hypothetical protein